ncbi:unnamed protein product [Orchesella dallaii]|uniref:C2H2-type domain-containing protein n=1 Tax=Orchesella dallaii TaxID=48710 RepID=A0ABP1Q1I6_9HEXA
MGATDFSSELLSQDKFYTFGTSTLTVIGSGSPPFSLDRQVTQPASPEVGSPSSVETLILSDDDDKENMEEQNNETPPQSQSTSLPEEKNQLAGTGSEDGDKSRKLGKCIVCLKGQTIYNLKDALERQDGRGKKALTEEKLLARLGVKAEPTKTTLNENDGICGTCIDKLIQDFVNDINVRHKTPDLIPVVTTTEEPVVEVEGTDAVCSKENVFSNPINIGYVKKVYMAATHAHLIRRKLTDKDWDFICTHIKTNQFSKSIVLENYLNSPQKLTHIYCVKCEQFVENGTEGFNSHVISRHPYAIIRYPCDICGLHLPTEQHHAHWITHFYPYPCCNRRFPSIDGLRRHCQFIHNDVKTDTPVKCDHCKISFKTLLALRHHQGRIHKNYSRGSTMLHLSLKKNFKTDSKSKKIPKSNRKKEKTGENMEVEPEVGSEQSPDSTTSDSGVLVLPDNINRTECEPGPQSSSQSSILEVHNPQDPSCIYLMSDLDVGQNSIITSSHLEVQSPCVSTASAVFHTGNYLPESPTPNSTVVLPESQNIGPLQTLLHNNTEIEVITLDDDDDESMTGVENDSPPPPDNRGIIVVCSESVGGTGNQRPVVTTKLFINWDGHSFPFQDTEVCRAIKEAVLELSCCKEKEVFFPLEVSTMDSFASSGSDQLFLIPLL